MFVVSGKLVVMDDGYLHINKRIILGNYELSTVEEAGHRSYLIGATNGSIEALKISFNEDITTSSQLFFFSKKPIVAIRHHSSVTSNQVYFAVRTEENHLVVATLSNSKPKMMLNLDKNVVDVGLS